MLRRVARRFGWGLADQAMSSVSNAAVSFYVAQELGATQFGAFSLAYVTYSFALNASRGLATDPLVVRYSNADPARWRRAVAKSTGTAVTVGLVAGACAMAAAMVLHGTPRLAFLALGLMLPGLMLQDSWRYAFFAVGRGGQAFLNDTVWTLSLLPALAILRVTHHGTVLWFVLAWGLAAAVAACVGPLQARTVPRLAARGLGCRRPATWGHVTWRRTRPTARPASCAVTVSASSRAWPRSATFRPDCCCWGRSWSCSWGYRWSPSPKRPGYCVARRAIWSCTAWRSGPGWRSWRWPGGCSC